jgi:peptide/nickel transport system permease protein
MKQKPNMMLTVGLILIFFFLAVAVIGPYIAPYEKTYSQKIGYISTDKGEQLVGSPFPPSKEHLFGTDKWGYDIFSLLLYGAKYTIFTVLIVGFLRVIMGSSVGIMNGVASKVSKRSKSKVTILSGIPIFIIIYFIMLGININPVLNSLLLVILQGTLMTILGISGVYHVIFDKTLEIKKNAYIDAAKTLGANHFHIAIRHIFPALKGNLLIIFVNECIQVLHLIGQLGIFNLFLGGSEKQFYPVLYFSISKEWSGIIGQSRTFIYHSQWTVLFPLAAYLLLLFSFYLLSNGLNKRIKNNIRKTSYL